MDKVFLLPPFFDYGATFLWAISGALLAARRGYAILGILTVATVSSTGGGLLRDGIFIQDGPPVLVRTTVYLELIVIAVLGVVFLGRRVQKLPGLLQVVAAVDALGLGAYAVVGMDRATVAGLSLPGVIVVGFVNAVGGGILRDVLMDRAPRMFLPGTVEEAASLVGCLAFVAMTRLAPIRHFQAAWVTIGLVFLIRVLAIRFRIESRAVRSFEQDWKETKAG